MADQKPVVFDGILFNTLKNEGGETTDTGGHTNYGVTQSTYDAVAPSLGLPRKNVRDLNLKEVRKFYEEEFYKKQKIDAIPSGKVQGVVFDYAVNSGPQTAIKKLQGIVGTDTDGVMGPNTLRAVKAYVKKYGEDMLAEELINERANHYSELAASDPKKYGPYYDGWMNRLQNLRSQYKISTS